MRARTTLVVVTAIAVVGAASTALAAMAFHMPAGDAVRLAAIAAGAAAVVGAAGTLVLAALRRQSIGVQIAVVALATVAAVGAGAMAAAKAMFIASHDLQTLLVVILAAGTVGAMIAFVLGHRAGVAARAVGTMARRIGEGGAPGQIVTTTREFSSLARELHEMSARLQEARDRERAIEASRRELIAWVSHDLRTPLSGIRAIAESLEDGVAADPDTVRRYHRTMRIETERLSHLVDELFELSVIHAGALRLQMERVSLADLVSDAISAATPAASVRGVRLRGELSGSPAVMELAPPEVSRVLRNLLDNAIRHTPGDGSVWVETGLQTSEAYVSVVDECGGIAPTDLARVFDTSFRGERARTPADDGRAGLGLAIAKGIVEAHHGVITVVNHGPGCRFTVRLPLTQPP
jgi:signal transduction histidine kinase